MIGESTAATRLCPHCANSIAEDSAKCFYCKADFSSEPAPPWLKRDEPSSPPRRAAAHRRMPVVPAKFLWTGAMLVVAVLAFVAGGYLQRSDPLRAEANVKQLQAKDLMIQSQEGQLAQARQKLEETSSQLAETKSKLEKTEKELTLAQQGLGATRQAAIAANRSPVSGRVASRAPAASLPQPTSARQTPTTGVYETTRPTSVYEDPSSSARVISQIERGTRINVVGSKDGWLEVRSRSGNPPGYVRSDDARLIGGAS